MPIRKVNINVILLARLIAIFPSMIASHPLSPLRAVSAGIW